MLFLQKKRSLSHYFLVCDTRSVTTIKIYYFTIEIGSDVCLSYEAIDRFQGT